MRFAPEQVLVSCEHATNNLPEGIEAPAELMALHIAWDPGALHLARQLAAMFEAPLHAGEYSRLLVDLNRTIGNSVLVRRRSDGHSIPFNRRLNQAEIDRRVQRYYSPYRQAVSASVAGIIEQHGRCVHLCIHTFTPRLAGNVRGNDIGLLYDPRRAPEAFLVRQLRDLLRTRTGLVVWLNRPYSGTADGILPRIREVHDDASYVAIELEVNQKFAASRRQLAGIAKHFGESIRDLPGWAEAPLP